MVKTFCLHAHFEYPLSLDPWTQVPLPPGPQWPHPDFSTLQATCYGANSASRLLDPYGRILALINNFEHLSFSFDPALLDLLAQTSPHVYQRILRGGRTGNGVATAYSNTILPLLSPLEQDFQIEAGLAAFEMHFGFKPETFHLPQLAVSEALLDRLWAHGIRILVLSPQQAAFRGDPLTGDWQPAAGLPDQRSYALERPSGTFTVFFYDPGLSHHWLDQRLLTDADRLKERISARASSEGPLVLLAPGEVFGQTEPFGDMGLAALFHKTLQDKHLRAVNLPTLARLYPPQALIRLHRGENEEGCSAGCSHGLARWKRGCGCAGGGPAWLEVLAPAWAQQRQKWQDLLRLTWEHLGASLPWPRALMAALPLFSRRQEAADWWEACGLQRHTLVQKQTALRLVNAWQSLMKTQDPAGWQSSQWESGPFWTLLQEMTRAYELLRPWLEESDKPGWTALARDWKRLELWEHLARPRINPFEESMAIFLLDHLLGSEQAPVQSRGVFRLSHLEYQKSRPRPGLWEYKGRITVSHTLLAEEESRVFSLLEDNIEGLTLLFSTPEDPLPQALPLEDLPESQRQSLVHHLSRKLTAGLLDSREDWFFDLQRTLRYARHLGRPTDPTLKALGEAAFQRRLDLWNLNLKEQAQSLAYLENLLHTAQEFQWPWDRLRLQQRLQGCLVEALKQPGSLVDSQTTGKILDLLNLARRWGLEPNLSVAQGLLYEALQGLSLDEAAIPLRLGEHLGFEPEALQRLCLKPKKSAGPPSA